MTAKIITIVFVMLLISMESRPQLKPTIRRICRDEGNAMMKSDGPVAALQCEPVDIMAENRDHHYFR